MQAGVVYSGPSIISRNLHLSGQTCLTLLHSGKRSTVGITCGCYCETCSVGEHFQAVLLIKGPLSKHAIKLLPDCSRVGNINCSFAALRDVQGHAGTSLPIVERLILPRLLLIRDLRWSLQRKLLSTAERNNQYLHLYWLSVPLFCFAFSLASWSATWQWTLH